MATNKKDETASFVIRFTQKIFQNDDGESEVQWRGNIRHVQGGNEKRFSEFNEVVNFIQEKLADLTLQAMEDKSPEEQKGILSKSFDLWKKMALTAPKRVMETLKDPIKGVEQLQKDINQVGESLSEKLEIDAWRSSTKSDTKNILQMLEKMSSEINQLNQKVDQLTKNQKNKSK